MDIKSDPGFLLWKAWKYLIHKLILREHNFPQRCLMLPQYIHQKQPILQSVSLVQVFDKEVHNNTWYGWSAALCSTYAKKYKYGYVYAYVTPIMLNNESLREHRRTMHWARIPVLLWLLDHKSSVQWWFYLDIDAMINPMAFTFPLSWIFSSMHHHNGCVIASSSDSYISDLIFFSNAKQEPHMPCSGIFLASNTSGRSLSLWWNYPGNEYFNTHGEFDQHRVHELMYFEPELFNFTVLDIRPFEFKPSSYLLHYSGQRLVSEEHLLHNIMLSIGKAGSISYLKIIKEIEQIRKMHTISCQIDLGVSFYHEHDAKLSCSSSSSI